MAVKKKLRLKKKVKLFIVYIVLLAVLGYSLLNIFYWGKDNAVNNKIKKDIIDEVQIEVKDDKEETYIETDLNKLKEMNSDTVGWIQVPDTNINYPVLQTDNNDYYLNKNFYKNTNEAGWIFLDYRDQLDGNDKHIIVYGHNRLDGSMFGTLKRFLDERWIQARKYIYFNTIDTSNTYVVFSAYSINADDFKSTIRFSSTDSYQQYLNDIKSKSLVDSGIDVNVDDQIITL